MTGMIDQAIASEKAEELKSLLLQSGVYLSRLVDVGSLEHMSLTDIHNILVDQGGVRKDEWLSSRNVVSEHFFASDYKGVTSGRSGSRTEYYKNSGMGQAQRSLATKESIEDCRIRLCCS